MSRRAYGELCAWALAPSHARSGDRIAIASYLGRGRTFDDALAEFAARYAEQNSGTTWPSWMRSAADRSRRSRTSDCSRL